MPSVTCASPVPLLLSPRRLHFANGVFGKVSGSGKYQEYLKKNIFEGKKVSRKGRKIRYGIMAENIRFRGY